ncbi:hypothetical protein LPJGGPFB_01336 [Ensifer adhaerens]|nr:hypothetical protein [Ensifer adhaerens]
MAADGDFVQLADQWNARKGWDDYSNASIVHFTHAKPNTQECLHPEKATFLEYRRHTPWRKDQASDKARQAHSDTDAFSQEKVAAILGRFRVRRAQPRRLGEPV